MKTAVVGGGAAGFFLAINLKEQCPQAEVSLLERGEHVLHKVSISGGGRCNLTNTFQDVASLKTVYPRGHRLMERLLHRFGHRETYAWFEHHGVTLTVQDDGCVFPKSQDARSVVDCLAEHAKRLQVEVRTNHKVNDLQELDSYDFIAITTGGAPNAQALQRLCPSGVDIVPPVASLFSLSIEDEGLRSLMGIVVPEAVVTLTGSRIQSQGALLLTHWGVSGPAILRLSSYGARYLAEHQYQAQIAINWCHATDEQALHRLQRLAQSYPQRLVTGNAPFKLQGRLWNHLAARARVQGKTWNQLSKKDYNRLTNALTADTYSVSGRAPFRDEFVTCGGVSLNVVNAQTLECLLRPRLYYAGEVLDIDGITGGFNFQAAWTTAYVAAMSIARQHTEEQHLI